MIKPVLSLLFMAVVSFLGYFGSRYVDSDTIHHLTAKIFGSAYFLSIAFGTLYIFTTGSIRGVSLSGRILASFVVPFVWMSKEVLRLTESHPILECLYWYLNPLNVLLVSMVVMEMGIATLIARAILKQRGWVTRVVTPAPVAVIVVSLLLVISGYAWGKGENVYGIFLNGYRILFDFGIQIQPSLASGRALTSDDPKRPNIIFILGDNHNAKIMSFAGHPFIQTPGMDRLAREGIYFENAFNTTSLCSPSRASILTGAYAHRHGVRNNHTPWTGQIPTFLEYLSRHGYTTAFIGKWHMPGEGLPQMPFLDLFVSYTYREGQGAYFNCPMIVNGKETPSRKPYITEEVTDYAIEFMQASLAQPDAQRKPFCIYLSHRPGHAPYDAPAGIAGMYAQADVKLVLPKNTDPWWYGKTNGNAFQGVMMGSYFNQYRKYCETITAMDRDIVRLLNKIDETGLVENTLVIYMGDNGMQWGTHDRHGIREPYEDSVKLPLIVRAPWLTPDAGGRRSQMALNIDIAPTLLDVAGVPLPAEMDGESLVPLLRHSDIAGREAFLLEFWRYYPENTPSYKGVRTKKYKYIEFERGRNPWLFNLEKDPQELDEFYGTKEGEKILPALKALLKQLRKN